MADFWDSIDTEQYWTGFDRWWVRSRLAPAIVELSDLAYEALEVKLARQAYHNADNGLTMAENYYLIAEAIGAFEAEQYLQQKGA